MSKLSSPLQDLRQRLLHLLRRDVLAVDLQRAGAGLGEATEVVVLERPDANAVALEVELDRVPARRQRVRPFPFDPLEVDHVLQEYRLALQQVEAVAGEAPARGQDHALGAALRHVDIGGDERHEAMRDLSRARQAVKKDLQGKRQQISSLMLRLGRIYPGKTTWGPAHMRWLMAQKLEHLEQRIAFEELLEGIRQESERVDRLENAIREVVPEWSLADAVVAMQAVRGIDHCGCGGAGICPAFKSGHGGPAEPVSQNPQCRRAPRRHRQP